MKKFLLAAAALPVLAAMAGCGGGHGCTADIAIESNARYAGSYSVVYQPATQGAKPISATLSLGRDGVEQAVLTDPGDTSANAVFSKAGDVRNGCSIEGTSVEMLLFNGETFVNRISGSRETRGSVAGTYSASLSTPEGVTQGTLTVAKVAQ